MHSPSSNDTSIAPEYLDLVSYICLRSSEKNLTLLLGSQSLNGIFLDRPQILYLSSLSILLAFYIQMYLSQAALPQS